MENGEPIIWLDKTDSTNDEARRRILSLANLAVVAARTQTAGRGQGDHTWTSAPGENLTFSLVLLSPPLPAIAAGEILLVTQLVTRGIREYLLRKGVETRIKWPNDIYVDERKICGILIENTLERGRLRSGIVGIGLNLNQTRFPADLPNPVSLSQLTGQRYDLEQELRELHAELRKSASLLDTQEGRMELGRYFNAYVFRREG